MSNQPEETPMEVPEADAVEQRLSAIPDAGGEEFNPLPEDAPEADVLEQRTPLVSTPLPDVPAPDLSTEKAAEADAFEQALGTPGSDEDDYPFVGEEPELPE
jgi:hypothetical protein